MDIDVPFVRKQIGLLLRDGHTATQIAERKDKIKVSGPVNRDALVVRIPPEVPVLWRRVVFRDQIIKNAGEAAGIDRTMDVHTRKWSCQIYTVHVFNGAPSKM